MFHPTPTCLLCTLCLATVLATAPLAHAVPESGDPALSLLQQRSALPEPAAVAAHPIAQRARESASGMVIGAMNFLGVPYRRGGDSVEEGFDCSGFTRHVFENNLGLVLSRRADQQAKDGALRSVKRNELRPGDLVFFNTMKRAFSHVGIYIGEGRFIHAPRTGAEVRIEDMRVAYWSKRFNGARRAELPEAEPAQP
jgi:cell wall-associated NlpC family hydrolase